jgi:hypothetical protein
MVTQLVYIGKLAHIEGLTSGSIPIPYRDFAINNIRRSFGCSEENETPRHRYLGRKPWSFEKAGSFSPAGRRLETELMVSKDQFRT